MNDISFAIRSLCRSPAFTITAVLTLALGIGATTAIFSVVNAVLLRPLPYRDPDRLVVTRLSYPDFEDVLRASRSFESLAVWATNMYHVRVGEESQQLLGAVISRNLMPLLGVAPVLGRNFSVEDEQQRTVILGYGLWQSAFGADPGAVGRTIVLSGLSYTIIGVAPQGFRFPTDEFQLWAPMGLVERDSRPQATNRGLRIFTALGRLKDGVTIEQARAEMRTISAELAREHPATNAEVVLAVDSLTERIVGNVRRPLLVMLATVGMLLLIACANVANLVLTRTAVRGREIAIRWALGAGRPRLVRQLAVESLLLSCAGGLCGLLVAMWGLNLVAGLAGVRLPRADTIGIDGRILGAMMSATLMTTLVFGTGPALRMRADPATLKDGGRGVAGLPQARRLRRSLAVVEIALSLVAMIGAGLLVRSFLVMTSRELGFAPQHVWSFNVPFVSLADGPTRARTSAELLDRLRRIPSVEAAGGATGLALVTPQRGTAFEAEGKALTPDRSGSYFLAATPDYFRALGTPVIRGRAFAATDRAGTPAVAIISRRLADTVFPGEDPVGRRLRLVNPEYPADWRTIVGIVEDVRYRELDEDIQPAIYTPFEQTPFPWMYVMVRISGDPAAVARAIRASVGAVDPRLTAGNLRPMAEVLSSTLAEPRANMLLVTGFAGLALALAALGVYGVIAYSVAQRRHEIGIRMALGATRPAILAMVLREGVAIGAAGVALGLAGSAAVTRLMGTILVGITPYDLTTFAGSGAGLLLVALAASYLPARRATHIHPIGTFRAE